MDVENSEICYPDSPRVGRFLLPFETLRNGAEAPMLRALFGLCVLIAVEPHESGRGNAYIAASDLFEALNEGEAIPNYRIEFAHARPFPDDAHERRRLNNGAFGFVAVRQNIVRVPTIAISAQSRATH